MEKVNEQKPDNLMPGQIEVFGYKQGDPKSIDPALKKQSEFFDNLRNYVKLDSESDLRSFLYSPAGIATIVGMNFVGGEPVSIILFSILVTYDIQKWIEYGEPNWLFLITDLICVISAGFGSGIMAPIIKALNKVKVNNLSKVLSQLSRKFPQVWENHIIPLLNKLSSIISKITKVLKENINIVPKNLKNKINQVINFLPKVETQLILEITKTYAGYSATSKLAGEFAKTKVGTDLIKKSIPYINPLLGPDKLNPFFLDLMERNPNDINLNSYKIHPIFLDNSKDTF